MKRNGKTVGESREQKKTRDISYTKDKGGLIDIAMYLNMGNPDTPSGKKILLRPSLYHFPLPLGGDKGHVECEEPAEDTVCLESKREEINLES